MSLHPATQLLSWAAGVLALQVLTLGPLAATALLLAPLCLIIAPGRTRTLLRRARWLLLSIVVLFAVAVPGERLPGLPGDLGLTYDGLYLATEHLLRLALLLASLAVVHERLGNDGLMAGLHWLLAPVAHWRASRERIIVRLMLVLDYVEREPPGGWRSWLSADLPGPDSLSLRTRRAGVADWLAMAVLAGAALIGWALA